MKTTESDLHLWSQQLVGVQLVQVKLMQTVVRFDACQIVRDFKLVRAM